MTTTTGLTSSEIITLRSLLVKANNDQLVSIQISLHAEVRKRYEVLMAKEFGSYGNDFQGYRKPDGTKTKGVQK